jgi:thioester reductase-like protein
MSRLIEQLPRGAAAAAGARERLRVVRGDLAEPLLGLPRAEFVELARRLDVVYHGAADTDFLRPYSALRAVNVRGTHEILRLVSEETPKVLHYMSTLGVYAQDRVAASRVLSEDDPDALASPGAFPTGYQLSKWVADRLVVEARSRGLRASIYRIGLVGGDSETGDYPKHDDFLVRMLLGCIQLGAAPILPSEVGERRHSIIVPVDYVAKAMVRASMNERSVGKNFHVVHPGASAGWSSVWTAAVDHGHPLRRIPYEDWKRELLSLDQRALRANALYPLLEFVKRVEAIGEFPSLANENTVGAVGDLGCPPVEHLIERYLAYFARAGILSAPKR